MPSHPGPVSQEVIEGEELAERDPVEGWRALVDGERGRSLRSGERSPPRWGAARPVRGRGHLAVAGPCKGY